MLEELQFFLSVNLERQTAISIDLLKMSEVRHDRNLISLKTLECKKISVQSLVIDTNYSFMKFHLRHFQIKCALAGNKYSSFSC